jgi:hypothetical protein
MASIHRKVGSKKWYCCYSLPNGKRVYCTTGETVRAAAMRRACELEAKALAKAKETDAPQRSVLEQVQEAAALAKRGDLSLDRAREIMGRIVAASARTRLSLVVATKWDACGTAESETGRRPEGSGRVLATDRRRTSRRLAAPTVPNFRFGVPLFSELVPEPSRSPIDIPCFSMKWDKWDDESGEG